jgi:hypothetical protein
MGHAPHVRQSTRERKRETAWPCRRPSCMCVVAAHGCCCSSRCVPPPPFPRCTRAFFGRYRSSDERAVLSGVQNLVVVSINSCFPDTCKGGKMPSWHAGSAQVEDVKALAERRADRKSEAASWANLTEKCATSLHQTRPRFRKTVFTPVLRECAGPMGTRNRSVCSSTPCSSPF